MLGSAVTVGKTLGKAVYVFSPDVEAGKIAHTNFLPKDVLESKKLNAKDWLNAVSKVLGGKVGLLKEVYLPKHEANAGQGGGKDESATGVGSELDKITEAIEVAKQVYKEKVEA